MYVKIYSLTNFNQCDEICKLLEGAGTDKPTIDSSLYECVFKGPLKCDSPDDILDYFNDYSHPLFRNGSLVDADIIVTPVGAYGLVDYDFYEATFDESKVYRNPNMVRSVMIIPGLPAFETEFPSDHEALEDIFRGDYTTIEIADGTSLVINNDDNPDFFDDFPFTGDYGVVNGPGLFVKFKGSKAVSLSDDEVQKYLTMFGTPHFYDGLIFRTGDGYCCYQPTTTEMPSSFEVPELGVRDIIYAVPDYQDQARQMVCRGCPFLGDGCNACLHD